MADPFEVRMRFTSQLQHLNASSTSATKTAGYALKHSEHSEDLHSVILEQLERNSMNNRANIMYFLPSLCDTASAQNHLSYVRMMERDILRIIDLVAPDDGSGAANVKVVRKVLKQLEARGFLQKQTVEELEEFIVGRDAVGAVPSSPGGFAHPSEARAVPDVLKLVDDAAPSLSRSTPVSAHRDPHAAPWGATIRLDKRQIEQRIEEDRERHKRAREGIWAVSQPGSADLAEDAEFEKLWDEIGDVNEDDFQMAREELDDRKRVLEFELVGTSAVAAS